jgi:hypothetical protein
MNRMVQPNKLVPLTRWGGRLLGLLLLLFWGAFFVEHLSEWFIRPFPRHPPLKICFYMGLHFLILAGLLLAWRWEVAGSLLVIGSSLVFFQHVAGANFPLFFGVTAVPAFLLLFCGWQDWKRLRAASSAPR